MLENMNKNKNKKLLFETINIKTKNLDKNPNKGGTPANDNNINTVNTVITGKFPKNLSSFRDFKYFISKRKNIKNKFIKIKT